MAKKNGRPKIEITEEQYQQIITYINLGCTEQDVVNLTGIKLSTLKERIKEDYGLTFQQFYKKHNTKLKTSIRQNLYKQMQEGNTTATIFLAKTTLGLTEDKEYKDFNKKAKETELKLKEKEFKLKQQLLENGITDNNINITLSVADIPEKEVEVIEIND